MMCMTHELERGFEPKEITMADSILSAYATRSGSTQKIDRVYPLGQIVEAHRYIDTGRKRGNAILTVTNE